MTDQTNNPLGIKENKKLLKAKSQNVLTDRTRTEDALALLEQYKRTIINAFLIIFLVVSAVSVLIALIVMLSGGQPAATPKPITVDETIINEKPINASATPKPITVDETIINEKPINASLSFQYRAITATICHKANKDMWIDDTTTSRTWIADTTTSRTLCTYESIIQAENVHGYWTFEQEVGNSFIKLDRNNITMLKAFEGNFKINISMYRLIRGRYGFVSSLNDVPISTCIFEQLNEKFSPKTRVCDRDQPSSIRYLVDEKENYILTILSSSNVVKLGKGDIITLKIVGSDAFIVGNPTVSFSGIIFV